MELSKWGDNSKSFCHDGFKTDDAHEHSLPEKPFDLSN